LYQERGEGVFDNNTDAAHQYFDAHAQQFSPGIHNLLTAHSQMERFGMKILPLEDAARRREEDISQHVVGLETATKRPSPRPFAEAFEVALSFAGTERAYARELATALRAAAVSVFCDDFYPEMLWGKDLVVFFDDVYAHLGPNLRPAVISDHSDSSLFWIAITPTRSASSLPSGISRQREVF
jgi:hypothetical protein